MPRSPAVSVNTGTKPTPAPEAEMSAFRPAAAFATPAWFTYAAAPASAPVAVCAQAGAMVSIATATIIAANLVILISSLLPCPVACCRRAYPGYELRKSNKGFRVAKLSGRVAP